MARFLVVLVACAACLASANVVGKSHVTSVVSRRAEGKLDANVVAAAVKKAPVAAPAGLLSKAAVDKLQLVGLFAVWYAFNAGC